MMGYIILFALLFMAIVYMSLIILEKRMWNNGKCYTCGRPWHYTRTTENGEEYICPYCKHKIVLRKRFDNE